ncbi:hypothetical protein [Fischerella sp. NIES-3754]|uniref:hypothetical protein n=1 Tax=Fischerella sp. NIES-3754 TaxID=1752063 RepID=UPI001E4B227C|nr:hypothetical protein [Fischerella sp. NIES-3754]
MLCKVSPRATRWRWKRSRAGVGHLATCASAGFGRVDTSPKAEIKLEKIIRSRRSRTVMYVKWSEIKVLNVNSSGMVGAFLRF